MGELSSEKLLKFLLNGLVCFFIYLYKTKKMKVYRDRETLGNILLISILAFLALICLFGMFF